MRDMQRSFQKFKIAVKKFKEKGGKVNGQFGSRIAGIDKVLNSYKFH